MQDLNLRPPRFHRGALGQLSVDKALDVRVTFHGLELVLTPPGGGSVGELLSIDWRPGPKVPGGLHPALVVIV